MTCSQAPLHSSPARLRLPGRLHDAPSRGWLLRWAPSVFQAPASSTRPRLPRPLTVVAAVDRPSIYQDEDGPSNGFSSSGGQAGSFMREVQKLQDRLSNGINAERKEQLRALRQLYASSSLRRLQEEGVVLTQLSGEQVERLYRDFVWRVFPHPEAAAPAQRAGQGQAGRAAGWGRAAGGAGETGANWAPGEPTNGGGSGQASKKRELPYHKFQRGDSVLITWTLPAGAPGGTAAGTSPPPPPAQQGRQQPAAGPGGDWDGSSSGSDAEGGSGQEEGPLALESLEGTVLEVRRGQLLITLPREATDTLQDLVDSGAMLRLDKGDKDVTSERQLNALRKLDSFMNPDNRGEKLVRAVLVGNAPARCAEQPPQWAQLREAGSWLSEARKILRELPDLNASQRAAIASSLQRTFSLWQGPPGTGKTRTLLGFIHVLVETKRKKFPSLCPILATADTNAACDNLVEGLLKRGINVVRVGQPAKVRPELREACLDARVEATASGKRAAALLEEATRFIAEAREGRLQGTLTRDEEKARREAGNRRWRQAEAFAQEAVHSVLSKAEVVAATCTGCADPRLEDMAFQVVAIDEASQATEPSTLIPLVKGAECVVMAGDVKQLPPTVVSQEALKYGLDVPLLARLGNRGLPELLLDQQYRMHPDIAEFPSKRFYQGKVKSGVSAEERPLIKNLPWLAGCPVLFMHREGREERAKTGTKQAPGSAAEGQMDGGHSFQNQLEAESAMVLLQRVLQANPDLASVAVLTPYNGQVRLLTRLFRELPPGSVLAGVEVSISSVDGFQGREAELVIFSTVRSNDGGKIGFVADQRRLNVAITRARRGLVVLGNGDTLRSDPNWFAWFNWLRKRMTVGAPVNSSTARR